VSDTCPMDTPDKIRYAAQRLRDGHRVNRITVRDFLNHFGAERRGAIKVEEIRRILDSLDLQTDPDFETAWIDEPIWLRLKAGILPTDIVGTATAHPGNDPESLDSEDIVLEGTPSAVRQALEQSAAAPTSAEPDAPDGNEDSESFDPTFRIGSLPAANKTLVVVNQDDSITTAVTLMLEHDFSQLPVMQGDREVKGVITWKSICARLAFGSKCERVADCREDARIVDANRTLFDVIPTIVDYGYVLVRQRDRKITGVVTASDLSSQFHVLTEPFLLLREIELHVRRLVTGKLSVNDLNSNAGSAPPSRLPQAISDLTLGEYVLLLQNPQTWGKLNLKIDRTVLTKLLDEVRVIRNDVMHFDPDPMTPDELGTLKRAVRFMQELYQLFP
jgi:CBS domain-containing protein